MRKIKNIVFILAVFLLTGCSASYNLTIDSSNNVFAEKTSIYESNSDLSLQASFESIKQNKKPAYYSDIPDMDSVKIKENTAIYTITDYTDSSNYGLTYAFNFPSQKYYDSNMLKSNVENYTISESNNTMKLQASKFKCFDNFKQLQSLRVNINIANEVVYNNADYVSDNTYTWIINSTNYTDKKITIYYKLDNNKTISGDKITSDNIDDNTKPSEEPDDNQKPNENVTNEETEFQKFANQHKGLIILIAYIVFSIIIFIVIKIKKRKL